MRNTACLLTIFLCFQVSAAEIVGITDGDTLTALIKGKEAKVRLAQIDAPEKGQPFGSTAKQALSDLAYGKDCEIEAVDQDRYGRLVGQVVCGGLDVNAEMVRTGHAWAYRKYLIDNNLLELEAAAKGKRIGLWVDSAPIEPWEWRRQKKSK